ncbi:DUF3263 domain-containing protein [Streptomyces sp. NPDC002215]|uniref:DUF3263 domain-containing protein n=1 Tax=Streptomyces sp. NPDC002215 TaxID=3154412 RepID=UPI00332AA8B2
MTEQGPIVGDSHAQHTPPATTSSGDTTLGSPPPDLTLLHRKILDAEGRSWTNRSHKERYIRETLCLRLSHYYQLLNALLDDARALAYAPVTVNRLRRVRESRRSRR